MLVGFGQLLVAFIFSDVVSQYPVAGGIYPWVRRLWGRKYAWMTGRVYLWALLATIAAVAYGSRTYFSALIGVNPTSRAIALAALLILVVVILVTLAVAGRNYLLEAMNRPAPGHDKILAVDLKQRWWTTPSGLPPVSLSPP